MDKKYKYITISPDTILGSKPRYKIINNKDKQILGLLFYYVPWRQYVFTQYDKDIVFNSSCLLDIITFMKNEL